MTFLASITGKSHHYGPKQTGNAKISAKNNRTSWERELNAFLRSYRSTPYCSTNTSPASLVFIKCNTSRLPPKTIEFTPQHNLILTMAKTHDKIAKDKMKLYGDTKRKAKPSNFNIGDKLLYHQHINKRIHNKYENQF